LRRKENGNGGHQKWVIHQSFYHKIKFLHQLVQIARSKRSFRTCAPGDRINTLNLFIGL
jgi:hypothetical protein